MKLTRVRTFVVQTPPPYAGGALWFFVKLETDNGLVGWVRPPCSARCTGWRTAMSCW